MGKSNQHGHAGTNSKRRARNENEKRRRDKFNLLIDELAVHVVGDDEKLDKSAILRCAISYLKDRQLRAESTTETTSNWFLEVNRQAGCSTRDLARLYIDALGIGTFCMTCSGIILHASPLFAQFFDKSEHEVEQTNILHLLDKESAGDLDQLLTQGMLTEESTSYLSGSLVRLIVRPLLQKSGINLFGFIKATHFCRQDRVHSIANSPTESHELCFVGIAQFEFEKPTPIRSICVKDSSLQKVHDFTIVYNMEFICINIDRCAENHLGYSNAELLGTSGYNLVHNNDLDELADSHRKLLSTRIQQTNLHRLCSKGNEWLSVRCIASINDYSSLDRIQCTYSLAIDYSSCQIVHSHNVGPNHRSSLFQSMIDNVKHGDNAERLQSLINSPESTDQAPLNIYEIMVAAKSSNITQSKTDNHSNEIAKPSCCISSSKTNCVSLKDEKSSSKRLLVENNRKRAEASKSTRNGTSLPNEVNSSVQLLSPNSPAMRSSSSPKRCTRPPLVYIEHYPLPDSRKANQLDALGDLMGIRHDTAVTSGSLPKNMPVDSINISPMYRHIWEELQRQSQMLRHQVFQKEVELRELHLRQFLASLPKK